MKIKISGNEEIEADIDDVEIGGGHVILKCCGGPSISLDYYDLEWIMREILSEALERYYY